VPSGADVRRKSKRRGAHSSDRRVFGSQTNKTGQGGVGEESYGKQLSPKADREEGRDHLPYDRMSRYGSGRGTNEELTENERS